MILKRQPLSQFSVADDIIRWTTHPDGRTGTVTQGN
jgi:hypothetical protein